MTTDELVTYYTQLKRIFYDKPFLKKPKTDTADWDNLNRLRILLEERNIQPEDFILVNVRAYRKAKRFPHTPQLLGVKAFNRYSEYCNKRYRIGQLYRLDPDSSFIFRTNTYYPISEFTKPFDNDLKALVLFTYIKEGKHEFDEDKANKIWEIGEYVLAKYEYFKMTPPKSFTEWKEKFDESRKKPQESSN